TVASGIVGATHFDIAMPARTGSEDFAFMLERCPGALIFIGNGVNPDGSCQNLHTSLYDFNDEILALGATYWVMLTRAELVS
ncbi:MAG: amidohydrolase, partial [Rhodospirillaceae bacterium]|nr:amidohydrolase [Rhodospirillaceae bacterium]